MGDTVGSGGIEGDATPAHADALFTVLLCVGGPMNGQLIERHPTQHSYVDLRSGETYLRRRFIAQIQGPVGTPNAFMQQILAWSKLNQAEIQANLQNIVMNAWFQSGVPINLTEPEPKSKLIIPNGG